MEFEDILGNAIDAGVDKVLKAKKEREDRQILKGTKDEVKEYEDYAKSCVFLNKSIKEAIPKFGEALGTSIMNSINEENASDYKSIKPEELVFKVEFNIIDNKEGETDFYSHQYSPGVTVKLYYEDTISKKATKEFFGGFGFEGKDYNFTANMNSSQFKTFCKNYSKLLKMMHYNNEAAWRYNHSEANVLPMEDLSQEFEDPVFGAFDAPSGPKM